jgi:serine phosphatase RsbU (regulator of sigma subunit)
MKHGFHAGSPPFRQAVLKSERLRILIVLGIIVVVFLIRSFLTLILWDRENFHLWLLSCALLSLFLLYEFFIYRAVSRAVRSGSDLSAGLRISNVIIETSVPAFALAFIYSTAIDPAYRPLANPSTLLFFIFIILSTLRLDPRLCRFSGIVAALSYLCASTYLGWHPAFRDGTLLLNPHKAVFGYAAILIFAGVVAGAVAGEIRKHVDAALHEAETKLQVQRLEHDLDVARTIQQSLLPVSMPVIAGFDIAAWNQPADQTGGDYYDWQPLPDGRVLVALADVTGHGIGPALLAAVCRAYARTNFTVDDGLLDAMTRINASLSGDLKEGRFVTFVAAICTPGNSRVELLSAGHGPLFFYTLRHDRFDAMKAHGMPLGISSSLVTDPPQMLELDLGDMLVLATDGFFEWENAQGEQFGVARLEATIRASRERPASEIIATLYSAVIAFSQGTPQKDDLTAIIIKRT